MQNVTFEKTQKKGELMVAEGFCYTRHSVSGGTEYWVCEDRKHCRGRAMTKSNRAEFLQTQVHSHLPNCLRRETRRFRVRIQEASSSAIGASTSCIVQTALMSVSGSAKAILPVERHISKNVQNNRTKTNCQYQLPQNRAELIIPPEFQKTGDPNTTEQFLLWDSFSDETQEERILIFATQRNLEFLRSCQAILMDGTFQTVPPLFHQLYSIHGTRLEGEGSNQAPGKAVPLVYCLLPNKTEATYRRLFHILKNTLTDWQPQRVMLDFERAAINAVKSQWPAAKVTGCFFHLAQSINRKLQQLGLSLFYNDSTNCINIKMVLALAFVPPNEVISCWNELLTYFQPWIVEQSEDIQIKLEDFIIYFEINYIGRNIANVRREPRTAPIELWNVRDRILHRYGKTDNDVEGFHSKVKNIINCRSPNVWNFLQGLQKLQAGTEKMVEEINSGVTRRSQNVYARIAERLYNKCLEWPPRQCLPTYLRGIAHNFTNDEHDSADNFDLNDGDNIPNH